MAGPPGCSLPLRCQPVLPGRREGHGRLRLCFDLTPLPPAARFEENQSGTAEMEEFLPHGAEKKQTHFTDVSMVMGTVVVVGWG